MVGASCDGFAHPSAAAAALARGDQSGRRARGDACSASVCVCTQAQGPLCGVVAHCPCTFQHHKGSQTWLSVFLKKTAL